MILKNKKGLSLTELLIALALIGLISPLIFTIFVFGIEDYATTTKYVDQQYSVMEVTRYIREDVERAKKVTFIRKEGKISEIIFEFSDKSLRAWKFETFHDDEYDGIDTVIGLGLKVVPADKYTGEYDIDTSINYVGIIDKLNLDKSGFDIGDIDAFGNPTKLILTIRPEQMNKAKYRGRNINENIITEFSVRYKSTIKNL